MIIITYIFPPQDPPVRRRYAWGDGPQALCAMAILFNIKQISPCRQNRSQTPPCLRRVHREELLASH